MILEFAAWRKMVFRRVTGTMLLSIRSRSTSPAPTDGSWSTSPTNNRLRPRLNRFEQIIGQQQVEHGGFVHDQEIQIERIFIVVFETFQRGKFQQAMNGSRRSPGCFGKSFGGAPGRRCERILHALRLQRGDQSFQAGGLPRTGTACQHTDRMGQRHLDRRLLFVREMLVWKK